MFWNITHKRETEHSSNFVKNIIPIDMFAQISKDKLITFQVIGKKTKELPTDGSVTCSITYKSAN